MRGEQEPSGAPTTALAVGMTAGMARLVTVATLRILENGDVLEGPARFSYSTVVGAEKLRDIT